MTQQESLREAIEAISKHVANVQSHGELPAIGDMPEAAVIFRYLLSVDAENASTSFLKLVRSLRLGTQIRNPVGYLNSIVRSVRVDEARSAQREIPVGDRLDVVFEDPTEGLAIDLAEDQLDQMLLRLTALGEKELARLVVEWVDLAAELGRYPSSREVADKLDVSHQTVLNRLRALRSYARGGGIN